MTNSKPPNDQILIYKTKDNKVELKVKVGAESIWLSQRMMADLFNCSIDNISLHLKNIFKEVELKENSVVEEYSITASDGKKYKTKHYNLDTIISVGYRVNSKKATQFRIWATSVLKSYLVQGYVLNEEKLIEARTEFNQLQRTINFLVTSSKNEILLGRERTVLSLLHQYSKSITFLEKFDNNTLPEPAGVEAKFVLVLSEAKEVIRELKIELIKKKEATILFGQNRDNLFSSIIGSIYQTFDGVDLYSSIEEKAAHLLYFMIKDHPFSDGNKRSASFLFIYFLEKNNYLYSKDGLVKINNASLVSLALLVAQSDPKEKAIMIKLITNLLC